MFRNFSKFSLNNNRYTGFYLIMWFNDSLQIGYCRMQQISLWLTTLIYYYYLTNHTIQVTAVLDEEEGNNELREQLVAS